MKSEGAGKKSNILAYIQYCSSLTESNGLGFYDGDGDGNGE